MSSESDDDAFESAEEDFDIAEKSRSDYQSTASTESEPLKTVEQLDPLQPKLITACTDSEENQHRTIGTDNNAEQSCQGDSEENVLTIKSGIVDASSNSEDEGWDKWGDEFDNIEDDLLQKTEAVEEQQLPASDGDDCIGRKVKKEGEVKTGGNNEVNTEAKAAAKREVRGKEKQKVKIDDDSKVEKTKTASKDEIKQAGNKSRQETKTVEGEEDGVEKLECEEGSDDDEDTSWSQWGGGDGWGDDTLPPETLKTLLSESASKPVGKTKNAEAKDVKTTQDSKVENSKAENKDGIEREVRTEGEGGDGKERSEEEQRVLDRLTKLGENKETSWGWGNWGTSILSSATESISTFTNNVEQGLNTFMETVDSTMGAPTPDALAQQIEDVKEPTPEPPPDNMDVREKKGILPEVFGGVLPVDTIKTVVESTVTGGIDVLEAIGKKTYEVISQDDPGLRKKRALLRGVGASPNLSDVTECSPLSFVFARHFFQAALCI